MSSVKNTRPKMKNKKKKKIRKAKVATFVGSCYVRKSNYSLESIWTMNDMNENSFHWGGVRTVKLQHPFRS